MQCVKLIKASVMGDFVALKLKGGVSPSLHKLVLET